MYTGCMSLESLRNAQELEQAFIAWNREIFRYVYARVSVREIAEDITQDVFIKVWNKRAYYDKKKGGLRTWIFTIAVNTLRDHFRSQKRRPTVEELKEDTADEQEQYPDKEVALVFSELKFLSEKDQNLLILRYVDGLSLEEIGDVMKMKYTAVKVAIHRAVQKLRKRL